MTVKELTTLGELANQLLNTYPGLTKDQALQLAVQVQQQQELEQIVYSIKRMCEIQEGR